MTGRLCELRKVFGAVVVLSLAHTAYASNASEPHPHKGLIQPRFQFDGKPSVKLSAKDMERIEAGHLWMQAGEVKGVGSGIGIRDIAAPPEIVYSEISNLQGYVGKVPLLKDCKVYESTKKGSEVTEKATYVVRVIPGYNYEYYCEHRGNKQKGTLIFYLDYNRHSDFRDLQGKWYVEAHPSKPGWSRVYYQCDLMLWGYAPAIVKSLLTSKGLQSAIGWVKQYSEKRAPAMAPAFAGGAQLSSWTSAGYPIVGAASSFLGAMLLARAALRPRRRGGAAVALRRGA